MIRLHMAAQESAKSSMHHPESHQNLVSGFIRGSRRGNCTITTASFAFTMRHCNMFYYRQSSLSDGFG